MQINYSLNVVAGLATRPAVGGFGYDMKQAGACGGGPCCCALTSTTGVVRAPAEVVAWLATAVFRAPVCVGWVRAVIAFGGPLSAGCALSAVPGGTMLCGGIVVFMTIVLVLTVLPAAALLPDKRALSELGLRLGIYSCVRVLDVARRYKTRGRTRNVLFCYAWVVCIFRRGVRCSVLRLRLINWFRWRRDERCQSARP